MPIPWCCGAGTWGGTQGGRVDTVEWLVCVGGSAWVCTDAGSAILPGLTEDTKLVTLNRFISTSSNTLDTRKNTTRQQLYSLSDVAIHWTIAFYESGIHAFLTFLN